MADLNNPSASLFVWLFGSFGLLLPPAPNMRDKATQDYDFECRLASIAVIKAKMLGSFENVRTFDDDRIKQDFELGNIMTICSRYDYG